MNMRVRPNILRISVLALLIAGAATIVAQSVNLPTADILGSKYYYYEVKKGDSPYGVAKRFGWDYQKLCQLNPEATSEMKKGSRLYYPVDSKRQADKVSGKDATVVVSADPIEHEVKRGETVYSISRLYGISPEAIYASHPSAKAGIKAGEKIVINQGVMTGDRPVFYTIRRGDTLYAVAKANDTSVAKILELNPGVSEQNFQAGSTIRILPGSNNMETVTSTVKETKLSGFETYTVKKDDTWDSVAAATGANVESLRDANEGKAELKKNEVIAIPQTTEVEVEKEIPFSDPREDSFEGRQEVYDSIHGLEETEAAVASIAIVTDKPSNTRNIEFMRGFLLNLDRIRNSGKQVRLAVVDATADNDSVIQVLTEFDPKAIVSTFDKDAPKYVTDFAAANAIELINVFDVRSEEFTDNPYVIQILPPSSYFNDEVVAWLADRFGARKLVTVGTDANDEIGRRLTETIGKHIAVPAEDLDQYPLNDDERYLFYIYPTKKEEVSKILDSIEKIKEEAPFAEVAIVGRPAWVTLEQSLKDKFDMQDVYVPSRFWFDSESIDGKKFVADYTAEYGHGPLRSFPVYSVSGYDIASWLIPALISNDGDFNRPSSRVQLLQNDIDIHRVSNWGGFLNTNAYIVRFNPFGQVEKITVN